MGVFNNGWLNKVFQRFLRSKTKSQVKLRAPSVRPQVAQLEERCLPYTAGQTFNQEFVSQLYVDLLDRTVDPTGLSFWSAQLNDGSSRMNVITSIESSPEYKLDEVNAIYVPLLGRQVEASSAGYWEGAIQHHGVEFAEAQIAGSQEFFNDAGDTNTGYLKLLYKDLLHRDVDPSGAASFGAELNSGMSRAGVAFQILTSPEYRTDLVEADYEHILHRSADPTGLSAWVGALDSGATDQDVTADILGSIEDFTRTPDAPVITSPSPNTTTTATSFTITGTAESGSLVQILSNGNVVGTEQLDGGQTNFSISVPVTNTTSNSFTAQAINDFGSVSQQAVVPTISGKPATVALTTTASQTTPTNVDAIPVTATFNEDVTGFTESDITVTNGTVSELSATSGKVFTFEVLPTADGAVTVEIAADKINKNSVSNTLSFTSLRSDPVVTANSLTTSSTSPTLTGSIGDSNLALAAPTVSVAVDGHTFQATISGNTWTAATSGLAAGTFNIVVTATDKAGNSSSSTVTNGLVIETTPPTVTIDAPSLSSTSSTPTLTGTVSDPSAKVSVNVAGQTIAATVTNGNWSATIPTAIANGSYNVTVSATDAAGNVGTQTGTLTVNATTGSTITVTANPLTTKTTAPILTGTVDDTTAGATVTVTVTVNSEQFTATVNGNVWSANITPALTAGTYNISVAATDGTNSASGSAANGLVIDTTPPTVTITTQTATTGTPTISGTVSDSNASVSITSVNVIVDGETIAATVSGGNWSAVVPTALANGTYSVTANATDSAGNVGTNTSASGLVINVAKASTLPFSLTDNAWQTLSTGERIWNVVTGSGTAAAQGNTITVNYIGYLTNGTVFDASFIHQNTVTGSATGGAVFSTPLHSGAGGVIQGWVDSIAGMMPGGERRLDIPAAEAYGANPPPGIPVNAELVFDVTMISD